MAASWVRQRRWLVVMLGDGVDEGSKLGRGCGSFGTLVLFSGEAKGLVGWW